jgi:hypothetical protein
MRRAIIVTVMLVTALSAKDVPRSRQGVLVRMESVPCGVSESNAVSSAVFGAPTAADSSEERLCPEYLLRSEGLLYRIRQKTRKRTPLLPIGQPALFRIEKDRVRLQMDDSDRKVYEFVVMAIVPEEAAKELGMAEARRKSPQ